MIVNKSIEMMMREKKLRKNNKLRERAKFYTFPVVVTIFGLVDQVR